MSERFEYKAGWYDSLLREIRLKMSGVELDVIRLKHGLEAESWKTSSNGENHSTAAKHTEPGSGSEHVKTDLYNRIQFYWEQRR